MKTIQRYLILTIACVACSLALTFATYFYSYVKDFGHGWVWTVNRGWPLSWAVEMHTHVLIFPIPTSYPYDFQALNFTLDLVFWTALLLLPSLLYLRLRKRTRAERPSTTFEKQSCAFTTSFHLRDF